MICFGGVADGGGDVVLFEGYDGCHFAVCMMMSLAEIQKWVRWNSTLCSGDVP